MSHMRLCDFAPADASAVDALGIAAFEQFSTMYEDWPGFRAKIAAMSSLAVTGEIIVARDGGHIVGAVAYIGPHKPKSAFFSPEWAIMRMLVVSPQARGQGVGRALAEACIQRAQRDGARVIGLHTSPIMAVALPMYLRMGFQLDREVPPIHGVPYGIYAKALVRQGRNGIPPLPTILYANKGYPFSSSSPGVLDGYPAYRKPRGR